MSIILNFTRAVDVYGEDGKIYHLESGTHEVEDYLAGWIKDRYLDSLDRDSITRAEAITATVKANDPTVNSAIAPIRMVTENADAYKNPTPVLSTQERIDLANADAKNTADRQTAHAKEAQANGRPVGPTALPNQASQVGQGATVVPSQSTNPGLVTTADVNKSSTPPAENQNQSENTPPGAPPA